MAATLASAVGPSTAVHARPVRPSPVEILVVSADDTVLEQVGQALDGSSIVRPADTPAAARALRSPARPCVLIVDARGHDDLPRLVEDLQTPDGGSIVVLLAPAADCAEVARAARGSATFAVLPIPLEPNQASAVILGATEEALARAALLSGAPPLPATAAMPVDPVLEEAPATAKAVAGAAPGSGRRIRSVLWLLLFAIACGVALAAWFGRSAPRGDSDERAPERSFAEPVLQALPVGSIDDLLEAARTAMRERRYTAPADDNALDRYRAVLRQEPGNGEALEGLQRIAAVLHERVEAALDGRRLEEASRTLGLLRAIDPAAATVGPLETRLADVRQRQAETEQLQATARARPGEVDRGRTDARTPAARDRADLQREAAARADVAAAAPARTPANDSTPASGADLPERQAVAAASTEGAPAGGATHEATTDTVRAPRLTRTRHVAPKYPSDALRGGVAGSVRLRLVVDAAGRVVDAAVVNSTPPGVFEGAATAAARKWRYKPIGPKNSDVTATADVVVSFIPEDAKQ